jgi:hypothetical protein
MSEWITDRLPTEADADEDHRVWWTSTDGEVMRSYYGDIQIGEIWAPRPKPVPPKPYVKPEPQRWKPKEGHGYYVIRASGTIVYTVNYDTLLDERNLKFGNCFETEAQAEEAARRVRETLLNYHKELNNESLYTKPL